MFEKPNKLLLYILFMAFCSNYCIAKGWQPTPQKANQSVYKLLATDSALGAQIISEAKKAVRNNEPKQSFMSDLEQLQRDLKKVR
jgi:hypothetical protein